MTAPTEPLVLTFGEAAKLVAERTQEEKILACYAPDDWAVLSSGPYGSGYSPIAEFTTWDAAAEYALKQPVEPRDPAAELTTAYEAGLIEGIKRERARNDAAELRAALREWAEATRAAEWFELDQTNAYGDDHIDAEYRVEAARRVLLALAATEGSES